MIRQVILILFFYISINDCYSCPYWNNFVIELTTKPASNLVIENEEIVLKNLLAKLYNTAGIYHHKKGKPNLEVKNNINIAEYDSDSNKIFIDRKLVIYALTQNEQKRESLYLQVVGHELGHYFNLVNKLVQFKKDPNEYYKSQEIQADFYSIFTAMLAGYGNVKYSATGTITTIYSLYKLPDLIDHYPSKDFRMDVADRALEKADTLFHLFQFANVLTAGEAYEPAIEIYEYLIQYYGGAEFYNNLGILYTLQGLQENYPSGSNYKRFYYPLEMDLNSKLSKVRAKPNLKLVYKPTATIDTRYYQKALEKFDTALLNGSNQAHHKLNKAVALILLRKFKAAQNLLPKDNNPTKILLQGLIDAEQQIATAEITFKSLEARKDNLGKLAHLNLKTLSNTYNPPPIPKIDCKPKNDILRTAYPDESNVRRLIPFAPIKKDSRYSYGWVDSLENEGKGRFFVLYRDQKLYKYTIENIHISLDCSLDKYYPSNMGLNFNGYNSKKKSGIQFIVINDAKGKKTSLLLKEIFP